MMVLKESRKRVQGERGATAFEDVALLPLILVVVLAGWQILVVGVSDVMLGRAAATAAREYAVTGSLASATEKARSGIPSPFNDITVRGGSTMNVSLKVPGSLTGVWGVMDVVETSKSVTEEPR